MLVNVTNLDQLLWWRKLEDMSLDDFLSRLRRESAPSRQMEIGTAWHKVLENPPADDFSVVDQDGFQFDIQCDAQIVLPQVREIRAEKSYDIAGTRVTLTGGCDGISGNVVTDHKLTARPDPEKYMDSYQWRAYLEIFGADVFEYVLYHAKDEGEWIVIRDVAPFRFYRYPEIERDLVAGIRDYVDFCREHMPEAVAA